MIEKKKKKKIKAVIILRVSGGWRKKSLEIKQNLKIKKKCENLTNEIFRDKLNL